MKYQTKHKLYVSPQLADLIRKETVKSNKGRPRKDVLSSLAEKYKHKDSGDAYYACVAVKECGWVRSGNPQLNRVLSHAASCNYLSDDQKQLANSTAASSSLGVALDKMILKKSEQLSTAAPSASSSQLTSQLAIDVVNTGRKELMAKVDHCIVKLICVNGLIYEGSYWTKYKF